MKYFTIIKKKSGEIEKLEYSFINRWMDDQRMDSRYLKDKSKRYQLIDFDMYPNAVDCPSDVYNLWKGFAAESMCDDYDEIVRAGLRLVLEHFKMLCSGNKEHYDFLLNILAHAIQHPSVKLGIMLCLVWSQGVGKTMVLDTVRAMIGEHGCFTTSQPQKDVYGDNNGKMKDAFFVRIEEADKTQFKGYIGALRSKISDNPIRIRELFCKATNVKNYSRFFADTNFMDAIPDEHGERRFFIVKCNEEKKGDAEYFVKLAAAIANERVIRALYDKLKLRKIKKMYIGNDIPIGRYQKALKDTRRQIQEKFLVWLLEDQDLNQHTLHLNADQIYEKYKEFQDKGNEFERSKESVTSWLRLKETDGITQTVPNLEIYNEKTEELERKQIRMYHFDLIKLRKHYDIGTEQGDNVVDSPKVVEIDCEKDIADFEAQRDLKKQRDLEAAAAEEEEDEEGEEEEEEEEEEEGEEESEEGEEESEEGEEEEEDEEEEEGDEEEEEYEGEVLSEVEEEEESDEEEEEYEGEEEEEEEESEEEEKRNQPKKKRRVILTSEG